MKIFLADLGHNLVTETSDTYPLGVGNLAAYAKQYAKASENVEVSIYRDPAELKTMLDRELPDVIGFTAIPGTTIWL